MTSTRFLRRPSRLTGQPFRLASKDLLPGAKVEPPVGYRYDDLTAHGPPQEDDNTLPVPDPTQPAAQVTTSDALLLALDAGVHLTTVGEAVEKPSWTELFDTDFSLELSNNT